MILISDGFNTYLVLSSSSAAVRTGGGGGGGVDGSDEMPFLFTGVLYNTQYTSTVDGVRRYRSIKEKGLKKLRFVCFGSVFRFASRLRAHLVAHRFLCRQLIQAFLGCRFLLRLTKAVPKCFPLLALLDPDVIPAVLVRNVMPPVLQVSRPSTAKGRPQGYAGAYIVIVQVQHVQQDRLVRLR